MPPTDPHSTFDRSTTTRPPASVGTRVLVAAYLALAGALLVAMPVAALVLVELLPLGVLGGPVALFAALFGVAAAPVLARRTLRAVATLLGPASVLGSPATERRAKPAD